jgi:hypothetical protein
MPVALVDEVVHLLGDDVGCRADPLEHAEILHQRRHDLAVAGRFDDAGEHSLEVAPARRLRRQDVAHSWRVLELWHGHSG